MKIRVVSKADEPEEFKASYCPYCGQEVEEEFCENQFECGVCGVTFVVED